MFLLSWKDTIFSSHVQDSKTLHFGIATQICMHTQRKWRYVIFYKAQNWYRGATQWCYLQALRNIWQGAGLHIGTTQGHYLQALPNFLTQDKCWCIYVAQGNYL
jgi:hypothetical protein